MKSRILVVLSLVANVALAAVIFFSRQAGPQPRQHDLFKDRESLLERAVLDNSTSDSVPKVPLTAQFHWSQIETNDCRIFIARLRSAGCPEPTIQDIIIGAIIRQYDPRVARLRGSSSGFWQTLQRRKPSAENQQAMLRDREAGRLEQEKSKLVQDLLGIDLGEYVAKPYAKPDRIGELLSGISETAQPRARQILQKYDRLDKEIIQRANGTLGQPEQVQLRQAYSERVAELKQFLSPQEIEEYELRASPVADTLRNRDLLGFSPTEEEFRKIFRIRKEFEEPFGFGDEPRTEADRFRSEQSRQQLENQLREALGETRFADYQRSQDFSYRRLVELTEYYALPTAAAVQVHAMRAEVLQQAQALSQRPGLSEAARQAALAQIQAETSKAVAQTLGDEAYRNYLSFPIGQWIKKIPEWSNGVVLGR